jgi:beta-xylosidase
VEYCKLYTAFERGVRRVSDEIRIGGPALANRTKFLDEFLDFVKKNNLKLDFVTAHYYGTSPQKLNAKTDKICVDSLVKKQKDYERVLKERGFAKTPFIIDEWGMATAGFWNREECPDLMVRETEVFSAYFAKLIYRYIEENINIEGLMICLSGQHEMVEDFSGFRNFFTLNFIKKPIYNAYILSGKLGEDLLSAKSDRENVFCVPTKREDGSLSVLVSYSSEYFEESIPDVTETLCFDEEIKGKRVTVWCIDKTHTNPYRLYQKMGIDTPNNEQLCALRAEGVMKPFAEFTADKSSLSLDLTPNATYLVTME